MRVQIVVIAAVNPVEKCANSEYWRVEIVWRTPWSKPNHKSETERRNVSAVHEDEVNVCPLFQERSVFSVQISNQEVEAKEVKVVGHKNKQEKAKYVLGSHIKDKNADQLNSISTCRLSTYYQNVH